MKELSLIRSCIGGLIEIDLAPLEPRFHHSGRPDMDIGGIGVGRVRSLSRSSALAISNGEKSGFPQA